MVNPNQLGFFDHCHLKSATINIRENHELMRLSDVVPWHELIDVAQDIRLSKVKAATGPDPRYRELLGSVVLMAVRPVGKFTAIKAKTKEVLKKVKALARSSHLFAKDQGQKSKVGKKMYHAVKDLHEPLAGVIGEAERKLHGKASTELDRLNQVMGNLLPQILYFLETGFVALKKIIHLQMSELIQELIKS